MDTFKQPINEFIDWSSGINSSTGRQTIGVDAEHPISGYSIRNLIQDKLKKPFVTDTDDKVRFFSSTAALDLWKTYKRENTEESLAKAEDLVLYEMDLPSVYAITGLEEIKGNRYVIYGNSSSENARIIFTPGIMDSMLQEVNDTLTITYQIKDKSDNVIYGDTIYTETGIPANINVYPYLKTGINDISIKVKSDSYSAEKHTTLHIYVVEFSIDTNFAGYYNGIVSDADINFYLSIYRSITNLPITVTARIKLLEEGSQETLATFGNGQQEWKFNSPIDTITQPVALNWSSDLLKSSETNHSRKYRMVIEGKMTDTDNGRDFYSNVLVYEFEIRPKTGQILNNFVNISYSTSFDKYITQLTGVGNVILQGTQYIPFSLNWGYYNDINSPEPVNIHWKIRKGTVGHYVYTDIITLSASKGTKPNILYFIPSESLDYDEDNSYLVACREINGSMVDIGEFPLSITENNISVTEIGGYSLKLSASGKVNDQNANQWIDTENNITTTFSAGVEFDNKNGWNNQSLTLIGQDSYVIVDYCPFPHYENSGDNILNKGCTFQIDFKPEYVYDDNDTLLLIGDENGDHISIKPNSACFYEGSESTPPIVKTNYKSGERITLTFILNKKYEGYSNSKLVYIINNGILERAGARSNENIEAPSSRIKIGGSRSGIRVYSIKAYRNDMPVKQALQNYIFENLTDESLKSRNDLYGDESNVAYNRILNKQDVITIEGNLTNILKQANDQGSGKKNATVKIERHCNSDESKNFTVTNCRIRNHGQSTLRYPITSMKVWFNQSNIFTTDINGIEQEQIPEFVCTAQSYLGLNKNRYLMKDGSIPANKFVLQANYADSSGTHNGSLLRLIQDCWYNAKIDNEYKLRTAPQLFSSGVKITHNNSDLNEDGTWVEGLYNVSTNATDKNGNSTYHSNWANKTWPQISGQAFPYDIRIAPDSFPCVVFYKDTSTEFSDYQLLGQYVFMDDKKSDYVFGERSIYLTDDLSDPFCLKTENKKKDKETNCVWDNKNVLQIEVVYPNSPLTAYTTKYVATSYTEDEETGLMVPVDDAQHKFDEIYKRDGENFCYYWEQHFELIYPDADDIEEEDAKNGIDKFNPNSKFVQKVTPFLTFFDWITDVAELGKIGAKLGVSGAKSYVTQAELDKFTAEAHQHLDLYKLAAYYIFFLRFGLVDSVERNVQLKTYDGQHWHYEPWDMDIALGCANNGVIAFEPPIDRSTPYTGGSYAFSGRTSTQSNVLWDCLESWDYWADTIVPKVAQALYDAGLTYENASKMFDKEYSEKWSETLYNESGQYKYIEAATDPKWRKYLNGARVSHRHWWLSTSMNYYDAKWTCGDFTKHSIEIRVNKLQNTNTISIKPVYDTFFKGICGEDETNNITDLGPLLSASKNQYSDMEFYVSMNSKQYTEIYGATAIEEFDVSSVLSGTPNYVGAWIDIDFKGAYDSVLGTHIRVLKLGAPCTPSIYENPNSLQYTSNVSNGQNGLSAVDARGNDALENLEVLDIVGWYGDNETSSNWISTLLSATNIDRKNIHTIYAMGCDQATSFNSSQSGNNFVDLRLPATIQTITMNNSSWQNLSFWETTVLATNNGNRSSVQYDKVDIPYTLKEVNFYGTTGKNECSLRFVLDWIDSIKNHIQQQHPSYTTEQLEQTLLEELSTKTLRADQLYWGTGSITLTYKDLIRLSSFGPFDGNGKHVFNNIKGYIVISDGNSLTSAQLTELIARFGDNVFNIGTTIQNLVVDSSSPTTKITVSGATIEEDILTVYEPNSVTLQANHFNLSFDSTPNVILNEDITSVSDLQQNVYYWGILQSNVNPQSISLTQFHENTSYAALSLDVTGKIELSTQEGSGDYTLLARVFYKNEQDQVIFDTVQLNIVSVIYPDISVGVDGFNNNGNPRIFKSTATIANDIFGTTDGCINGVPVDTYVMYRNNQGCEFYLNYTYPDGTPSNRKASINSKKYFVRGIGANSSVQLNGGSYMSYTEFQESSNTVQDIGADNPYLGYIRNSVHQGIPLIVKSVPATGMQLYRVLLSTQVGGRNEQIFYINIILTDDSRVIIAADSTNYLYQALKRLYDSEYAANISGFYKTHLLSLYGSLTFYGTDNGTQYDFRTVTSLTTDQGDTVFNYLNYITAVDLTGCSLLMVDSNNASSIFNFTGTPNLLQFTLNGCTSVTGTVDFTTCPNVTTIDFRGSRAGISLPSGSAVTMVQLGSPGYISITNPIVLTNDDVSIESKQYLSTISITGMNQSTGRYGYNTLYKLLNTQAS